MMVPTWCCWVRLSRWWARCSATGLWGKSARRPASTWGGPSAGAVRSATGVVIGERVPDSAQRFLRWRGAIERQPAHSAEQTQQFGDAMAWFGWWNGGHGRSPVFVRWTVEASAGVGAPVGAALLTDLANGLLTDGAAKRDINWDGRAALDGESAGQRHNCQTGEYLPVLAWCEFNSPLAHNVFAGQMASRARAVPVRPSGFRQRTAQASPRCAADRAAGSVADLRAPLRL
jgi:hypothetical protein